MGFFLCIFFLNITNDLFAPTLESLVCDTLKLIIPVLYSPITGYVLRYTIVLGTMVIKKERIDLLFVCSFFPKSTLLPSLHCRNLPSCPLILSSYPISYCNIYDQKKGEITTSI